MTCGDTDRTSPAAAISRRAVPVCQAYLRELVVLSNGDLTTCCFDAHGLNRLGNCYETSLEELWNTSLQNWHRQNIACNERGENWHSSLCAGCLSAGVATSIGAKITDDPDEIRSFESKDVPFPSSLVIEPTAACNYQCWGCSTGLRALNKRAILDYDKFAENILPVVSKLSAIRLYNYGEPFLHPRITDIMQALRKNAPDVQIHVSTNAMFMSSQIIDSLIGNNINYLIISMHGGHTEEDLLKYAGKGPDISRILENIRHLVEKKKSAGAILPWVCIKSILFDWNDSPEYMQAFQQLGDNLGVDFVCWDLNSSDPSRSSRRVFPGSDELKQLEESRRTSIYFYIDFPAWPRENAR